MRYSWKKILFGFLWLLAASGTVLLFGAAMQHKNAKTCAGIKVTILGAAKHMFIDEKDVQQILENGGVKIGKAIGSLDLMKIERLVESNPWVAAAELFIDNQQNLEVTILERQPVARVFTLSGNSFYLDSSALRLPLSAKLSARVPVFTGFPSDNPILARPDSALMLQMVEMGKYILSDSFWMAQIAQVQITANQFELIPLVGDQIIAFGTANQMQTKFQKLEKFYQKAWLQNGINKYEKLDLQYANQIVAVLRGANKTVADSLKAKALMEALLQGSSSQLEDSSYLVNPAKESPIAPPVFEQDSSAENLIRKQNNIPIDKSLTNKPSKQTKTTKN